MDKILSLIGLAKKAGMLEVGEEPTGAAARARSARLLLLADDAAENSYRRLRHFADAGQCLYLRLPATKEALGRAVGRTSCAMAAVTDIGFAEAIARRLAAMDPEQFGTTAERLAVKAERAAQRRREQAQHEKNVRTGKYKHEPAPQKTESAPVKEERRAAPKRPTRDERDKRRRSAQKRAGMSRFANARPVKKGKGSARREKP